MQLSHYNFTMSPFSIIVVPDSYSLIPNRLAIVAALARALPSPLRWTIEEMVGKMKERHSGLDYPHLDNLSLDRLLA